MHTVYWVVSVATVMATLAVSAADFARLKWVLANMTEVGVPLSWLPALATLKAAGAGGLLIGLLGVPVIGMAAAVGLVLFFLGAVVAHVRARVFYNIAFPVTYLLLAIASLVLVTTQ
jgi:hypothetical protein